MLPVVNYETIKELSAILREKELEFNKDIYLISDEPYREIIYIYPNISLIVNYRV